MATHIQDPRTGRFAGSIGKGKTDSPAVLPSAPVPFPGLPSAPPSALLPVASQRARAFDDEFDAIPGPDGEAIHADYPAAVAAAGGDPSCVWTVFEGAWEPGSKVWKFSFNGDEQIVEAEDEDVAREIAAELFDSQYEVGDTFEADNPPVAPEDLDIVEVSFGDSADVFDEDAWEPATRTWAAPGRHEGEVRGYVASTAKAGFTTLAWR